MEELVKIVVFVPLSHAVKIRKVMGDSGAGKIGKYSNSSFSSVGMGRFKPGKGTHPFIGQVGKLEEVEEERIETICDKKDLKKVIAGIKSVHPYEESAIDVYPLLNL